MKPVIMEWRTHVMDWSAGHWCDACLRHAGIRFTLAIIDGGIPQELSVSGYCEACGPLPTEVSFMGPQD